MAKKKYNPLTADEETVMIRKGTEKPFSGEYDKHFQLGIYVCKRCHAPLFRSSDKFNAHCGWPSFDDEIKGALHTALDPDGQRTEIICASCQGHLGHVFNGECLTEKNTRHCVNSIALTFIPIAALFENAKAGDSMYGAACYAGGCFWGLDYYFVNQPGVLVTQVGYMGGYQAHPTYEAVCAGNTAHAETLLVIYDKSQTDFETLSKLFFELHDPSQQNRQGPDVGTQYRSALFYLDEFQQQVAKQLIALLEKSGVTVVTEVKPANVFWPAEDYHQDYYKNRGGKPYCHTRVKRFSR